jgi:predicted amidohydrolase YtcJ
MAWEANRCGAIQRAYAPFEGAQKGFIEPGKLADLIVLDR